MCYSGKCRFERHDGECEFPSHIPAIKEKYNKPFCHPHLTGEECTTDYNESIKEIQIIIEEFKYHKEQKEKEKQHNIKNQKKFKKIKQTQYES